MQSINFVSLIVSIVAGIVTIVVSVQGLRNRSRITWRSVESSTRKVVHAIQESSFEPEWIVGVGRGGAIFAGMLAGNLGHVPLFVVDTILERLDGVSIIRPRLPDLLPDMNGRRIIVAVGELYSGEDLRVVVNLVKQRNPTAIIKTSSLFTHPAVSIRADYIGRETSHPLTAPWRMTEVYKMRRM